MTGIMSAIASGRGGDIVTAPSIVLSDTQLWPADAHIRFTIFNNGNWYYDDQVSGTFLYLGGGWILPTSNAGNYEVRMTRTGGTETAFTAGSVGTWVDCAGASNIWRLSQLGSGTIDIVFTIEFRRKSDSVIVSTSTGNSLTAESTP